MNFRMVNLGLANPFHLVCQLLLICKNCWFCCHFVYFLGAQSWGLWGHIKAQWNKWHGMSIKGRSAEQVCMPGIFIPDLVHRNLVSLFMEYCLAQHQAVKCLYKYQQMVLIKFIVLVNTKTLAPYSLGWWGIHFFLNYHG